MLVTLPHRNLFGSAIRDLRSQSGDL